MNITSLPRCRISLLLLASIITPCLLLPISAQAEDDHTAVFHNGDTLHGTLVSVSPKDGLTWTRADVNAPIVFSHRGLRRLKLQHTAAAGKPAGLSSVVNLTNGDRLLGDIVSLDNETLLLDTWYAGKLTIQRPMIAAVFPGQSSPGQYQGPNSLEEWTTNQKNMWEFKDDALHAKGSTMIGNNIEMPDRASLSFTIEWASAVPQFRLAFHAEDVRNYSKNCYTIRLSSSYARLYRYGKNNSKSFASASFSRLNGRTSARFRVLADKKDKRIIFMIDDKMIKQWTDPEIYAGTGSGMVFYTYGPMTIKNIKVAEWDGTVPGPTSGQAEVVQEDTIQLMNNDRVTGSLEAIAGTNVAFKTSYADLTIPLTRVTSVSFAGSTAERARRNANDVRIKLRNGGLVTFNLTELKGGKITGTSENFDNATVELEAIHTLDFNIYTPNNE